MPQTATRKGIWWYFRATRRNIVNRFSWAILIPTYTYLEFHLCRPRPGGAWLYAGEPGLYAEGPRLYKDKHYRPAFHMQGDPNFEGWPTVYILLNI